MQQVCPEVVSESKAYTIRDFAAYANGQGVPGALEVKQYLGANWSYIPVTA